MNATARPNILVIMSDQHGPMFSEPYGHPIVRTPNMQRLASQGVVFEYAYCNSPICVPSRMSFLTGRHIQRIGIWDNGVSLRQQDITWPDMVRAVGYDAVLAGKMHLRGQAELPGFRTQLSWDLNAENEPVCLDWSKPLRKAERPWSHIATAGPGTSPEIEVDDRTEDAAVEYIREAGRLARPWALTVGFIAPHFPLIVPEKYWNLYDVAQVDLPNNPPGHVDSLHPVYKRINSAMGNIQFPEDQVRRARAAYYGLVSYVDEKIGSLLDTLEATGQGKNTLVIYTSDHGEMLGEHGMWRKNNFYDQSSRVPLIISWPDNLPEGTRRSEVVSLVDVTATIIAAAAARTPGPDTIDGNNLLPVAKGETADWKDEAFAEYYANGVARPMAMLRKGRYKLNYSLEDPLELYDLQDDPGEFHNIADSPAHVEICEQLRLQLLSRWNPIDLELQVRRSQLERLMIRQGLGA